MPQQVKISPVNSILPKHTLQLLFIEPDGDPRYYIGAVLVEDDQSDVCYDIDALWAVWNGTLASADEYGKPRPASDFVRWLHENVRGYVRYTGPIDTIVIKP